MCLAVPAKIIERTGDMAIVELEGIRKEANVAFLPKALVGDYVVIHAGFAIQQWSEQDVAEWRTIMNEMQAALGESTAG